jgi:hypothetical protein
MPLIKSPNPQDTIRTIQNEGLKGVEDALKGVKFSHENLVRPWKESEDKPDFEIKVKRAFGLIIGEVIMEATEAESAHISVWQLLNKGTRIRYMMVSDDWVSKTWPGRTSSGAGSGFKTGLDFEDPRGGIDARDFDENITKEAEPGVDSAIETGYDKGFQKAIGTGTA